MFARTRAHADAHSFSLAPALVFACVPACHDMMSAGDVVGISFFVMCSIDERFRARLQADRPRPKAPKRMRTERHAPTVAFGSGIDGFHPACESMDNQGRKHPERAAPYVATTCGCLGGFQAIVP